MALIRLSHQRGFSLVELITVMVIVGVLAASVGSRLVSNSSLQLQAARDQLIAAIFIAQQKAMAQTGQVQLTVSGATVDVRVDSNGDGNYAQAESISYGGTRFPLTISGGVTFSSQALLFDRIGHTAPTSINATKNSQTVAVTITGSGYAY